jgi:peptidoglycan/xylan/chitin deacetylase (PgdA/CDA1 family)
MRWSAPGLALFACLVAVFGAVHPAQAVSDCPGNPNALGTSRTLVVDPREHPRIGTMQYAETLPLADKEVVLTFDDGPIPRHSNAILDILAAECIKATFFVVGIMAKEHPDGVRRLRAEGHTVATHTEHHPLGMKHMGSTAAQAEIDGGIAATTAALGGEAPAPFFRIPGLSRAEATENYAAAQGLQVWSADFPADDWRHITPQRVHDLAISRIEAKGRGILLLHDIQERTVAALPNILRDLKAKGYRIVHVVPASKDLPATATDPQQWRMQQSVVATAMWPAVPGFAFARSEMLPIPTMPHDGLADGALMLLPEPFDRVKRLARGTALPIDTPWLQSSVRVAVAAAGNASLPVPGPSVFKMTFPIPAAPPEVRHVATRAQTGVRGQATAPRVEAIAARRLIPGSMPVTRPGLNR